MIRVRKITESIHQWVIMHFKSVLKNFFSKLIFITLFGLYCLAERFLHIDEFLQNFFYKNNKWILIDADNFYRNIFYYGIKYLIYFVCFLLFGFLVFNFKKITQELKLKIGLVFCCMIFIPLLSVALKSATRIDCPYDLNSYGGKKQVCHLI